MLYKIIKKTTKQTKAGRPMAVLQVAPISKDGEILEQKTIFQFRNFVALEPNDIADLTVRTNNHGYEMVQSVNKTPQQLINKLAGQVESTRRTSVIGNGEELLSRFPKGQVVNFNGVIIRSTGVLIPAVGTKGSDRFPRMEFEILEQAFATRNA